jgi:hypothetical protein
MLVRASLKMVKDTQSNTPFKSFMKMKGNLYFFQFVTGQCRKTLSTTLPVMLGGHSGLDPPLPISNRAVKRTSANDSMLFACESRSPPSYLFRLLKCGQANPLYENSEGFLVYTALVLKEKVLFFVKTRCIVNQVFIRCNDEKNNSNY